MLIRGSRALGAALLTAVLACGAFTATTTVAAAEAPKTFTAAQADELSDLVKAARLHSEKPGQRRLARQSMAVPPQDCLYSRENADVTAFRYAGGNRYETAVCASYWSWGAHNNNAGLAKANAVVLARGDAFPDALAGGPLATHVNGPLLLTSPTALLPNVKAEIQRVLAPGGTVHLLGGTGSLSAGVNTALTSAGFKTTRIAGANRFETAIKVAQALPATSNFFVTTGMGFPDALAAGGAAATLTLGARVDNDPATLPYVLLFTNNTTMPAITENFVYDRAAQLGGAVVFTAGGAADQAAANAFGADNLALRFAGANRFETARMIAQEIYTDEIGLVGAGAGLANGMDFPDALAGTAMLARFAQPLLLTQATVLSAPTRQFLQAHAGTVTDAEGNPAMAYLDILGGTGVISTPVADAAFTAFTPVS
ncbi:cell wall-binding repeat-containing protein [Actinokineospora sp. 24-640]